MHVLFKDSFTPGRKATTVSASAYQIPSPLKGVDIWVAPIEPGRRKLSSLASIQSLDEQARQSRLHVHARDGYRRYVAVHALLREILATYLDVPPAGIEFRYGRVGKPALVPSPGGKDLRFNLSHSGDLALVVVATGREVGIDLERMHRDLDVSALADRSLSPRELAIWEALDEGAQRDLFYRLWVRKEAYLKGIGVGLTWPLRRVDVSRSTTDAHAATTIPHVDGLPVGWTTYDLELPRMGTAFVAALAVEEPLLASPNSTTRVSQVSHSDFQANT
jgi:4'-phosphopantetheinyl transferase